MAYRAQQRRKWATRDFNPVLPQSIIDKAMDRDPAAAAAEYMAQFRTDVEGFITREAVEACVTLGVGAAPRTQAQLCCFVDPSGGSSDAMTIGDCSHRRQNANPGSDPRTQTTVLTRSCHGGVRKIIRSYRCTKVYGDRYGGEWPREQFRKHGVNYEPSEKPKSELYRDLLPLINSGAVDLLEHDRLVTQLTSLERRTARGGRDSIDHAPGAHDDIANAVGGCCGPCLQAAGREQL